MADTHHIGDPVFMTVATRAGEAFVLLMVGAVLREWRRRRSPDERSLIAPTTTTIVLTSLFLISLFAGQTVFVVFVALLGLLALNEYSQVTIQDPRYSVIVAIWLITGLPLVNWLPARLLPLLPISLFLATTLVPIVSGQVGGAHRQVGGALFGYVYIGVPMAYMVFIRFREAWGLSFLLVLWVVVLLSDTCGYIVGSKVKGPKMAPRVSPSKTWSGAVGSVVGAAIGAVVMHVTIPLAFSLAEIVSLAVAISLCAIWSDLIESFIKRDFKVKDAGTILPGFGGVLDRFDSLLMTIPIAYYVMLGIDYFAR
jgi:phosphatidate cytidylyltransferase